MISSIKIDNSWKLIESFTDPSNIELLDALSNGCNAIRLVFTKAFSKTEIQDLLQDIYVNMLTVYAEGNKEAVQELEKHLGNSLEYKLFCFKNIDFEEELQAFLAKAKNYIASKNDPEKMYIVFETNMDYLQNICKIRSIRVLWAHLLESFSLEQSRLQIICQVAHFDLGRSLEEDYILSSIQMMSSVLGGGDGIEIKTPQKSTHNPAFRKRIARNLHHLATLESNLDHVQDPLKGSYFIEKESNTYARSAWNKFTL